MPYLIKLVLFSSSIHQLTLSILSTMPFAIGQVCIVNFEVIRTQHVRDRHSRP